MCLYMPKVKTTNVLSYGFLDSKSRSFKGFLRKGSCIHSLAFSFLQHRNSDSGQSWVGMPPLERLTHLTVCKMVLTQAPEFIPQGREVGACDSASVVLSLFFFLE